MNKHRVFVFVFVAITMVYFLTGGIQFTTSPYDLLFQTIIFASIGLLIWWIFVRGRSEW